ncbi:hypothetical protein [Natronorubrum sp. A-ect3]
MTTCEGGASLASEPVGEDVELIAASGKRPRGRATSVEKESAQ